MQHNRHRQPEGRTTKTTTTSNLGIALATHHDKRVLLVDADPQGDLTTSLGWTERDEFDVTLATQLKHIIKDDQLYPSEGILRHSEGVDLMPGNIELSGIEMGLVNAMSREYTMKTWPDGIKGRYDYVLIDCMPSLGMITINALTAVETIRTSYGSVMRVLKTNIPVAVEAAETSVCSLLHLYRR